MEEVNFGAPIPGQSLTTTPKERPWERPSETSTVDQALGYYFTNFRDPEVIDDLMTVVDMGIPLQPIVKTLYMSSVMNGHTQPRCRVNSSACVNGVFSCCSKNI